MKLMLSICFFIAGFCNLFSQTNLNEQAKRISLDRVNVFIQVYQNGIVFRTDLYLNNHESGNSKLNLNDDKFRFVNETPDSVCYKINSNQTDSTTITLNNGVNLIQKSEIYLVKDADIKTRKVNYLFEKEAQWFGRISSGYIFIQLMDGLNIDEIKNLLPENAFVFDGNKILMRKFVNLKPDTISNVRFEFTPNHFVANQKTDFNNLFSVILKADATELSNETKYRNANPYEPTPESSIGLSFLIILGASIGILILTIVGYYFYKIFRRFRRRKFQK